MRSKGPEIRRLLRARIRTRPRTCAELAKIYGKAPITIYHHMLILMEEGRAKEVPDTWPIAYRAAGGQQEN